MQRVFISHKRQTGISQTDTWAKENLAEFLYQMSQDCDLQTDYTFDDERPHVRIVTCETFSRQNTKPAPPAEPDEDEYDDSDYEDTDE